MHLARVVLIVLVVALSSGFACSDAAASDCLAAKPSISLSQPTANMVRVTLNVPTDSRRLRSISFELGVCPEPALKGIAFPTPNTTNLQLAEPLAGLPSSGWRTYRTSPAGCDTVHLFRDFPLVSLLKCFVVVDSEALSLNVSRTSRRGLASLSRDYEAGNNAESIQYSSTEDKFILPMALEEIYPGMQAHVIYPTRTDPVGSDFVATMSHVSSDILLGYSRKWTIAMSTKSKYPYELRTNAVNGLSGVALIPTGPWTHGEISLNQRCAGANAICEQVLTLEIVATTCEFATEYINVPNSALKYGCIAGSSAASQCPLASDTVSTVGTFAPSPQPMSIVINSGSVCSLLASATAPVVAPSLNAQLHSVNGRLHTADSWDSTTRRSLVPFQQDGFLYFSLDITSESAVRSAKLLGFALALPEAAGLNMTWSEYTSDTSNCSKSVHQPGNGWLYRVCLQVPMASIEPALLAAESGSPSTTFTFTANVTVSLVGDISFDASATGSVDVQHRAFSAASVGIAAAIVVVGIISLSATMIKFYRDQVRISTSRLSRKAQREYTAVTEPAGSSSNGLDDADESEDHQL